MLGGRRYRRRRIALIAYYSIVATLVGPALLSAQAGADTPSPVPVRIGLNFALRTPTTDVATFTTQSPITVGVAADGTFTIPRADLAFALVNVPIPAPNAALGQLTVRAAPTGDFAGSYDKVTGAVTLDGSLSLLWSQPVRVAPSTAPRMTGCPVGPFALHLSTATIGGVQLNAATGAARLVDDDLDVAAVPTGTRQCDGQEADLNSALSLPILPKPAVTTTTTTVPAAAIAADPTTTTTPIDVGQAAIERLTAAPLVVPTTDGAAPPIDPQVLAFEPIPSIVSMMTITAVPQTIVTTPTTAPPVVVTVPRAPTPTGRHVTHVDHHKAKAPAKKKVEKHHRQNKHAQTTAVAKAPVLGPPHTNTGSGGGSFGSGFGITAAKQTKHHSGFAAPLVNLGQELSSHGTGISLLLVGLLVAPLALFGAGLVASDLGWNLPIIGRRRRRAAAPRGTSKSRRALSA